MDDVGSKIRPLPPQFSPLRIFAIFIMEECDIALAHRTTYQIHLLEMEQSNVLAESFCWDAE